MSVFGSGALGFGRGAGLCGLPPGGVQPGASRCVARGMFDRAMKGDLGWLRRRMNRFREISYDVLLCGLCACAACAQNSPMDARWPFAANQGAVAVDTIHGQKATLSGSWAYVPGVAGDGVRFDGYTTGMRVPWQAADAAVRNGFTVGAWIALNTYPWNWAPIVDQEEDRQEGFFFGIDAFGHISLQASIDGRWQSVTSRMTLPLKKWVQVAGTYEPGNGQGALTIYVNGEPAGQMNVTGTLAPAQKDMLIGRVRQATIPFPEAAMKPQYPVWYSLDGILSDIAIYGRVLSRNELASAYATSRAPEGDVLPWQKMPSGPPGPGRFGAYYATLHYEKAWDNLRRTGPDSDVIVRFDRSPNRLVFWQGTNYIPAWVTGNDKWYTDEFLETWGSGCPAGGDCEPMSDKQERYSHVDILESNDARVVIHWRYALAEVEKYLGAWRDPQSGWFDWADEYWTVYPDGIAIRRQVLHSSNLDRTHEWQETIILHQPGNRPEDDINWNAMTLGNMQGVIGTYTWQPKPAGEFGTPNGPGNVTGPPDPNMQLVNIKSEWKPFQIVPPGGTSANIYNDEPTYFSFECWNHWPVAQIASSDRPCVSDDRASHSSLGHLYWGDYARDADTETKILMDGLTTLSMSELLPLARSWISPPQLTVESEGWRSEGYDPTQRAYVLAKDVGESTRRLRVTLEASEASPVFDPALVIKEWGESGAALRVDGKAVAQGTDVRIGHIQRLEGTDLVIWMAKQSAEPVQIEVVPSNR